MLDVFPILHMPIFPQHLFKPRLGLVSRDANWFYPTQLPKFVATNGNLMTIYKYSWTGI